MKIYRQKYCECGCGQSFAPKITCGGTEKRFVHGHNGRGKKRIFSDIARIRMSESHKGKVPWNKGVKGYKTVPCPEEKKKNIIRKIDGASCFKRIQR